MRASFTFGTRAALGFWAAICLAVLGPSQRPANAAAISPIGTNQNVLVICVKYNDVATTRLTNCSDWANMLQTDVNTFYNRATFGRTTMTFTAAPGPSSGWYDLGSASTAYNFFTVGQAAITLADSGVNFASYNRVAVVTNFTGFGGQGGGPWWWTVADGIEATQVIGGTAVGVRLMTLSITNEWVADGGFGPLAYGAGAVDDSATVVGHELGHQLGSPGHYGTIFSSGGPRDVLSPWSVMGLSPTLTHFLAWEKTNRDWTQSSFVTTVGPPAGAGINQLIRLKPIEQTPNGSDVQVIRVPLATSPTFIGYLVELRRQTNGDEQIPSTGVLVSYLDDSPTTVFKTVVLDDPSSPGDMMQSPLDVGEAFTDPAYNLTITYENNVGPNDANVRVQYNPPPAPGPNPAITPWGAPPWETTDIWIDSQKNGWGTYLYTDGSGNPTGNGDDAWVNKDNRVMVRVRNTGAANATNVRAQVFVNSPPGMGDSGANWDYLGTIVYPFIAAGASATNYVFWTPTVGAHTCIKVVLLPTPGESSASDNLAQENVASFDTSTGSPYEAVALKVQVNNPYSDQKAHVRYVVRDVPDGWGFMVEPTDAVLPPGGSENVLVSIFPSGFGPRAEGESHERLEAIRRKTNRIGFLGRPKLEAQIPIADTFVPIGGVEVWTRLVERTGLSCRIKGRANERTNSIFSRPAEDPAVKAYDEGLARREEPRNAPADAKQAALAPQPKEGRVSPPSVVAARNLIESTALIRPEPDFTAVSIRGPILVTGALTPAVPNATIAVEVRTLDGRSSIVLVKTNSDGAYAARLKPFGRGAALIRAYYAGDATHGDAESTECRALVR